MIRLAIYFSPLQGSELAKAAAQWLGRNNESLTYQEQKTDFTLNSVKITQITSSPFHYGFHGTLKPPFRPVPGTDLEKVKDRLCFFASQFKKFTLPPLHLRQIHTFFCLTPTVRCEQLHNLADETVRAFDDLRRPPSQDELQKRREANLSPAQEEMLVTWGYPYVMDQFRFHLTLTNNIGSQADCAVIERELQHRFPQSMLNAVTFSQLCLFIEENGAPMKMIAAFPLS